MTGDSSQDVASIDPCFSAALKLSGTSGSQESTDDVVYDAMKLGRLGQTDLLAKVGNCSTFTACI